MKKVLVLTFQRSPCLWIFLKGAGRNTLTGKKKGGLKIHTKMPMTGFVPDLIYITAAACNDNMKFEAKKTAHCGLPVWPILQKPYFL